MSSGPLLLSIPEALEYLGPNAVGRTTLYEIIARGEIRTVHIGRRHLVPRAALDAYVALRCAETEAAAQ
jgi:excisionase family DNA binding protein